MLKYGTAVVLYYKVLKKGTGKVRLGSSIVQKARIIQKSKTTYGWSFNLLKLLKQDTAWVFYCL